MTDSFTHLASKENRNRTPVAISPPRPNVSLQVKGATYYTHSPAIEVSGDLLLSLVGKDDSLGDLSHGLAGVHRKLLNLAKRFGLFDVLGVHDNAFGPLDKLPCLQGVLEVLRFPLHRPELPETCQGHLNGRHQLRLAERLDDVAHDAGFFRSFDQLCLAEGSQEEDGRDALLGEHLGGGYAVQIGHLDVHNDDIWLQLAGQVYRADAIAGLANDQVAQVGEHFPQVHANDRFIVGDNHSNLRQFPLLFVSVIARPCDEALGRAGSALGERDYCSDAQPVGKLEATFQVLADKGLHDVQAQAPILGEVEVGPQPLPIVHYLYPHLGPAVGQADRDGALGLGVVAVLDGVLEQLVDD